MRFLLLLLLSFILSGTGCVNRKLSSVKVITKSSFDWQGHRGCRGLMPENTIPAFEKALEYPVTTLELDVVVSLDSQLIVSHEPWLNPHICLNKSGFRIARTEMLQYNLYQMTAAEIREYDCGSVGNPTFPEQAKVRAYKPTLSEVVSAVRVRCIELNRPLPVFNIELKSSPSEYGVFTPQPEPFVVLVLEEISTLGIADLTVLQSFDNNILREIHRQDSKGIPISYLVSHERNLDRALERLGFIPAIYSPHHHLVSRSMIAQAAAHGMRVIPWTVNREKKMRRLIRCGVDGIITDYPDRIVELTPSPSR
jgi:glycerophosphoryl diester phosphodiesterase